MLEIDLGEPYVTSVPSVVQSILYFERQDCLKYLYEDVSLSQEEIDRRRLMLESKMLHTSAAVMATSDIIEKSHFIIEGTTKYWNVYQAASIAELHDLGRLSEAVSTGTYDSVKTGYNHANVGADLLMKVLSRDLKNMQLDAYGCDRSTIIDAVRYHNRLKLIQNEPYLILIRDADRLSNIRSAVVGSNIHDGNITSEVLDNLVSGNLVDSYNIYTPADYVIYEIAWLLDLNYSSTKRIVIHEKIIDKLMNKMTLPVDLKDYILSVFTDIWNERSPSIKIDQVSLKEKVHC